MKKLDSEINTESDTHDETAAAMLAKAELIATSRRQLRQRGIVGIYDEISHE